MNGSPRQLNSGTKPGDVRRAAADLAASSLAEYRLRPVKFEPVPLLEIAQQFGVRPLVLSSTYGPDGWIGGLQDGYEIGVRASVSVARQRFTLAHEIGHAVLAQELSKSLAETRTLAAEIFADEFASRVVLPKHLLDEWWRRIGGQFTIKAVEFAAQQLTVSLATVVKRLGDYDFLDRVNKGAVVGVRTLTRKGRGPLAPRVTVSASPSWGFIPYNRRLTSLGFTAAASMLETACSTGRTSNICVSQEQLQVIVRPGHRWRSLSTPECVQRAYGVRPTRFSLVVIVFDWPPP